MEFIESQEGGLFRVIRPERFLGAVEHGVFLSRFILDEWTDGYVIWCGADDVLVDEFHVAAREKMESVRNTDSNKGCVFVGDYNRIDRNGSVCGYVKLNQKRFSNPGRAVQSVASGIMPNMNGAWIPFAVYSAYIDLLERDWKNRNVIGTSGDLYVFFVASARYDYVYIPLVQVNYRSDHHDVRPWRRSSEDVRAGQLAFISWVVTEGLGDIRHDLRRRAVLGADKFLSNIVLSAVASGLDADALLSVRMEKGKLHLSTKVILNMYCYAPGFISFGVRFLMSLRAQLVLVVKTLFNSLGLFRSAVSHVWRSSS
jgi:hypothetical protein